MRSMLLVDSESLRHADPMRWPNEGSIFVMGGQHPLRLMVVGVVVVVNGESCVTLFAEGASGAVVALVVGFCTEAYRSPKASSAFIVYDNTIECDLAMVDSQLRGRNRARCCKCDFLNIVKSN